MSDLHPFRYDAFQTRAIDAIERGASVLVAAPTGSGKTVLADYVIERAFERRQRVIYTAPIKALSNQKFRDFTSRHGDEVGILTGDVVINATAPLIIMTTEIYRNVLLEETERLSRYGWVIFDEVHYLDDEERGTVWEEALLFTPPHIKLLCLSATIPNVSQIADWIRAVHGRPIEVIEETHRPVPLQVLFQSQNQIAESLEGLRKLGEALPDDPCRSRRWPRDAHRPPAPPNRLHPLVRHLRQAERLPCIFFTFGRRRAEDLAWEAASDSLVSPEEQRALRELYRDLCARYQLEADRTAEALRRLIDCGVAYHHAGMLPTMKEVIERCFTSRRLKLIFTTETFALGINMPARSVVLDSVKKRGARGFELLRRRDFLQMAGRAGRRGMDERGFVYLRINPAHAGHQDVRGLLRGDPEPVLSRFNTTYATLLNLYRRHGRGLLDVFPKTLYAHQTTGARRQAGLDLMQRKLDLLGAMDYLTPPPVDRPNGPIPAKGGQTGGGVTPAALTAKGEFASWLYGYELLLTELYTDGALTDLSAIELAVLLLAAAYEPRPRQVGPKIHRMAKRLASRCREPLARIHRAEGRFHVGPKTRAPSFHLANALEAWMHRTPFDKLDRLSPADEGELVRYFRMTIQLLRQLAESPAADPALRTTARQARERINRDVVDAEAQLRMG